MDIISNAAAATAGPLNRKGNVIRTRTNLHNNSCASDIGPRTTVQNTNNDNNDNHDDNDSFLHCNDDNHDALFNSLGQLESKKDVTLGEGFAQLTLPFRSTLMIPSAIANSNDTFSLSSPSSCPSPSPSLSPSATPMRVSSLSLTSSTNSFVSRSTPLSSSPAPLASTRQQASSSSIANLNVQDLPFFSSPFRSIPDTLPSEDAATLSRTLLTMTGSSDALPVATPTPTVTTTSMDKKRQDDDPETALGDIQGGQSSVLSLSACTGVSMYRDLSRGMSEQKDGSVPCHDQDTYTTQNTCLDPANPSPNSALSIFPGDPSLSTSSFSPAPSSSRSLTGQLERIPGDSNYNNVIVGATTASDKSIGNRTDTGKDSTSCLSNSSYENTDDKAGDIPGDNNNNNSPNPFLSLSPPLHPPAPPQSVPSTSTSTTTTTLTTKCPTHPTASSFVQEPNLDIVAQAATTSISSTTANDSSSSSSPSPSPQFTSAPSPTPTPIHPLESSTPHSVAFSLYPSPPLSDSSPPSSPPLCPSSSPTIVLTATFPALPPPPPTATKTHLAVHPLADRTSSLHNNLPLTELSTSAASSSSSPSWLHPFRKLKLTNASTTFSSVSAANLSSISFISSSSIEPPITNNNDPSLPSPSVTLPLRSSSFKQRLRSFSFSNDNTTTATDTASGDTSFLKRMVDLARNHTMPIPSSSIRRNSSSNNNTTSFAFATITLPKTLSNKSLDGYGHLVTDLPNLNARTRSSSSAASATATATSTTGGAGTATFPMAPIISAIKRGNFLALSEPLLNALLLSMAGKNSTALETINISGAAISAADAKLLAKLIRSSGAANIKILKLARNAISQQALKYIFEAWKYNQTITVLSLARSGINDKTVKYVAKMLSKNETLQELDLSSNRITASGMELLSEGLVYNRTLVRLCLQSNNIKREGAPFLARLLTKNRVLRHLNVGSNGLGSEGCIMIADAVRFNRTLNSLSLDMNEMGPKGATSMSAALVSNRHLNYLYLPHNNIGDQGLVEICESLKRNKSLIGLDLELNNIGSGQSLVGMVALGEVLRTNRTLREINLAYNLFSGDAVSELMKGVAVNSTLESINFTNCGISTEGALAIAEVLPSARGLQNLGLTSNPDIAVEGYWALSNNLAKNHSMKGIQLDYNSEDRHVLYEAIQHLLTRNFIWQQAIYAAACRILVLSRVVLLGRPANQRLLQTQIQQQEQATQSKGAWSLLKKKVGLVRTNSSNSYSSLSKHRSSPEGHSSGGASPLLLAVGNMSRVAPEVVVPQDEREAGSGSVHNLAHGNRPSTPVSLNAPALGLDLDLGVGLGFGSSNGSSNNSIRRDLHPLVLPYQQQQLMDQGFLLGRSPSPSPSTKGRPSSTISTTSTAYPTVIVSEESPYNAHKVLANLANMPYEIFETICAYLDPGHTMTIGQIRATIRVAGDRSTLAAAGGYYTKDLMLERIFESRYISPFGMRYGVKNGDERL